MNHVAIDLGGKESQICIRRPDGTIVEESRTPTRRLPALMAKWERCRVILETCAEAFHIADSAKLSGHEVRVVPATLVKTLGVGARCVKTDRRDAQVLSEVSCRIDLPSVHVPTTLARELKSLCGARETLVETRTKLINNVRGWLRTQLWRVKKGATASFAARVRGHAQMLQVPLPEHVERQLVVIETVNAQIRLSDAQVSRIAGDHPICRLLMTAPGVGPVTAVRFVAALDDVTRFSSAHQLESYLGLTPGEHSSSESNRKTGITKAGPRELRRVLVQAAWTVLRSSPDDPMTVWAMNIAARRGKFIAVVALARKLAGILFAMWRDGTPYRRLRTARPTEPITE
ncbi:MAG TPA: IS110 family transposase [Gemmatimonadaceae bacterium]|nr:IS110 family transposase [Gemmatimonadaceae bacterium]